ncbi:cytochrome oxidase assembly protein ShyY1 [Streptacidiphilus sp. MAP12-20]|uniref:SURF1 family cytochrome oxidase biogenesis protein n=1 Tax=Streptacidiphilus sp. MAP12-20 TaxID=3156299 RepID=UPI0035128BEA
MFRILLTRRWLVLTLVFLALIPAMVWLGSWQYHRYQQTNSSDAVITANTTAPAVAMETLSQPGATIPAAEMYRTVTAGGHFDTAHEFVVRHRTDASGQTIGFYLVTPLITDDGKAVLVNRGWIAPGNTSGAEFPTVPSTPTGEITVTGRLRPDETTALTGIRNPGGMPDRQFMLINSQEQAKRLAQPVLAGYLELTKSAPALPSSAQAELVPDPTSNTSGGMAVVGKGVHLPYAVQWWLFALLIPVAWWFLFRREVKQTRKA